MQYCEKSVIKLDRYTVGIDTSNYKTSIAVVDENNKVVFARSEFLNVKKGELGLRQQTAFFMHNNRLPGFISEAIEPFRHKIKGIGVSISPRNVDGSYMPVFISGYNAAKILSSALDVPIFTCSHQEGHIEAIVHDDASFILPKGASMHLSGGTTEVLKFDLNMEKNGEYHYNTHIIGGTKDISIGQLLDRIGVNLGHSFPSGKILDEYALNNINFLDNVDISNAKPSYIKSKDGFFNLSGIETEMLKERTMTKVPVLFYRLSDLLYRVAEYVYNEYKITDIYMCGGVSQSEFLRKNIDNKTKFNDPPFRLIFADKLLSGDNAIGVAWLANRNI